jgi:hypothetical protein
MRACVIRIGDNLLMWIFLAPQVPPNRNFYLFRVSNYDKMKQWYNKIRRNNIRHCFTIQNRRIGITNMYFGLAAAAVLA